MRISEAVCKRFTRKTSEVNVQCVDQFLQGNTVDFSLPGINRIGSCTTGGRPVLQSTVGISGNISNTRKDVIFEVWYKFVPTCD